MAKNRIPIKDIKTFGEIASIKAILDKYYDGKMSEKKYNGFLRHITSPIIRSYFASYFKPKSEKKFASTVDNPTKAISSNERNLGKTKVTYQRIHTVSPIEFSFAHSVNGPQLVYKSNQTFFLGEARWFQPQILKSIQRTFTIRLSDYTGFSFVPHTDKQEFEILLKQAFHNFQQCKYNEELECCFRLLSHYIEDREHSLVSAYQHIKFDTSIDEYAFDDAKQVYILRFNALEYQKFNGSIKLTIPLSELLEHADENGYKQYNEEISSKWPEGVTKILILQDILPNMTSPEVSIIIPKIFIDRFGKNRPIAIHANYSSENGCFKGGISSYLKGYRYQTDTSEVVFSDDIKDSLIKIMRNIDSSFIITFYTAFIRMFNEGDAEVQSIYDKHIELLKRREANYYDDWWYTYRSESGRYNSGISALLSFDKDNSTDWMWLTTQMKNGAFLNAYAFKDQDETYSSKVGDTVKYAVKVYLTVKDDSFMYNNYSGQFYRRGRVIISMYALDTSKSIYRFEVEKNKVCEALFFIWSYFSSNNYNKRQDFDYILSLKHHFGILYFYKDSPLEYRSGIGYCDRKWLE